jgi:serine/threonine protein kinase/tetratricopeptide (TPR) repeat protein
VEGRLMTGEEVFLAAVEKLPGERAAYLDAACAGNPDLRAQVDALLRSHYLAGSLLEKPLFRSAPTIDHVSAAGAPGAVIGPYKLVEPIGEGGMGSVWMAQQTEPVKRLVAVKLIRAGMDTKQVIARFEAERQALALMDHPNIAKVLDAGTTDAGTTDAGRPYFVMDLVKGVPITKYCDEHRLTPRQRLELFIPICQAVQHAHQKGIIHRDLKPTNVLVALYDGRPVPKVIDFGVAKAAGQPLTDKTLVTGFGTIVGTLEYMSPEQAEVNQLDVDTRSDIYSLGVLLYELLAGSPPFTKKDLEKAGMLEMLRVIREQEPSKPSTKLSTAEGLPTLAANRGTEPGKLTKLLRGELDWIVMRALEKDRNRRFETANGFAMDVQRYLADEPVQACPPSAGYRFRKFARRNKRVLAAAAVLAGAMVIAVAAVAGSVGWASRDRAARQAATATQVEQALEEVENLSRQGRLHEAVLTAQKAQALLQTGGGSDSLRERVRELLSDLDLAGRLEEAHLAAGYHVNTRYDDRKTMRAYAAAFREFDIDVESLEPAEAADRIRRRSIQGYLTLALDHWASISEVDPGLKKRLIAIVSRIDADPWRSQVRAALNDVSALKRLAASAEALAQPPASSSLVGSHLNSHGEIEAAVTLLREAQRRYPDDFWINHNLAYHLIACRPPRWDQAIRFLSVAVGLRPDSPGARLKLGWALERGQSVDEAAAMYHAAIRLKPNYVHARISLGHLMLLTKDYEDAREQTSKALERDPKNVDGLLFRAGAYCGLKRWAEALADCSEAIRLEPKRATAWFARAETYRGLGQRDKAVADCSKAITLKPDYVWAMNRRGELYLELNQPEKALVDLSKVIDSGPLHWPAWQARGRCYRLLGQWNKAALDYGKALELYPENASAQNDLAWLLATCVEAKFRDPKRALELAKTAVELAPLNDTYWKTLGHAEYRSGNWKAAVQAFQRMKELGSAGDSLEWFPLSMAYWKLGDKDAARKTYDRAVQWMEKHNPKDGFLRELHAEAAALMGIELKKE